jgi:hypothetical protein
MSEKLRDERQYNLKNYLGMMILTPLLILNKNPETE